MGYAMYDIHHLIKEIEAHPDTLLIFEIHVRPKKKDLPDWWGNNKGGAHNGYPLTRASEFGTRGSEDDNFIEDLSWRTYAWSFM